MALKKKNKPHVIICHTIKGKGISFAENKLQWHYFNLNEELHERAKRDIC
jgi:transketolase